MAALIALIVFLLEFIINCDGVYYVSPEIHQCCSYPVEAFILREFSGPCGCQTLEQKWKRYVDWVEMAGGYIHPWIELNYVHRYQDKETTQNTATSQKFKMHSHERGMFANIQRKYRRKIKATDLLMEVPFSISFSQFIISKYIKYDTPPISTIKNPKIKDVLFPTPDHFMPDV